MTSKNLKALRTRYRGIVEKSITTAKQLVEVDIEQDDLKGLLKDVKGCHRRLKEFNDKLESTCNSLMLSLEKSDTDSPEKDADIEQLLDEDFSLSSMVSDIDFELGEFQCDIQTRLDKECPEEGSVSMQDMFRMQCAMQQQFKDLLTIQQESLVQQREEREIKRKENGSNVSVKLPKIELKTFNGDRLKWLEFWQCFQTTVLSNNKISNIERFNYLKSVLRGEAQNAIEGLSLTNENYGVAIEILKERYGNIQNNIDSFYTELINLQPSSNKLENLRTLYNKIEMILRSLEALGQDTNQPVFISILTAKLPKDILSQLELQKGSANWTITKFQEMVQSYISAHERAERASSNNSKDSCARGRESVINQITKFKDSYARGHNNQINQVTSAEALFTGPSETERKSYRDMCRYCEGAHWSDECRKYPSVEERKERIRGSCYLCLRFGHKAKDCRSDKTCVHCKKTKHHHRSLCPSKFSKTEMVHTIVETNNNNDDVDTENMFISIGETVLMQTAKTQVKGPDSEIHETTRIILDSGSQRTYITEALAKILNLKHGQCNEINLLTFGEEKMKTIKTPTSNLEIKLCDRSFMTITVNIVPKISGDIVRQPIDIKNNEKWRYLFQSIELADDFPTEREKSTIDLLIGNDYYLDVTLPQRIEVEPGLYLVGSRFGWILSGRTSQKFRENDTSHNLLILNFGQEVQRETCLLTEVDKSLPLKPNMKDFWNLENIGIMDPVKDKGDDEALANFNQTVECRDNRYYVSWPWRNENMALPVNYELALGRLRTLLHKLRKNPELMKQYDTIIQDQISKGMIERVPNQATSERLHYIPHHAVVTPTKTTTKLRVVYDASAKTKATNNSLNDCLYRGPVMLQDLSGLLLRFRMNKIALSADIEKAFLQVGLLPTARDVTRFLWVKDTNKPPVEDNLQEYRFERVPFGIVSSPFLLAATIKYHMDQNYSKSTETIQNDIYVDNLLTGTNSVHEAIEAYNNSKTLFQDASMNLREWMSNSQDVMKHIPSFDHAKNTCMKVLGMMWNADRDEISLQPCSIKGDNIDTKREILGYIASTFDPLGLFNPVVLKGKLFLQSLWNKGIDWDEKLNNEQTNQWKEIEESISHLHEIQLPRYIGYDDKTEYKLLCFCDASKEAYSTAIYIHRTQGNEQKTDIVYAKSRVAPKKELSIPRLELLAVLIGVRCVKMCSIC